MSHCNQINKHDVVEFASSALYLNILPTGQRGPPGSLTLFASQFDLSFFFSDRLSCWPFVYLLSSSLLDLSSEKEAKAKSSVARVPKLVSETSKEAAGETVATAAKVCGRLD